MTDPQTTDAQTIDDTPQTANAEAATNTDAATDAQQAAPQEPRDLDVVFSDYETALTDFNAKVEQANAAKATAIAAAQSVADLKKELDALEGDVEKSFAPVEAFLASA